MRPVSSNDSQNKSKDGQIRSGRLVGKSLPLMIWILAMPALIQQFMAALVGLFDKILAGALPESIVVASLDGLGVGSYVGWLIGIAMAGIGIGKPRQRTQQQALASAGGTENHRNLARRQHRIHALEPAMLAMAEGQIVDAELHSPP